MRKYLNRKHSKRNCVLLFSFFLVVTFIIIFLQDRSHDDIPPLYVKKTFSEGWSLTGKISHVYGIANSYIDFLENGRELQLSEFKLLYDNYCSFYGCVELMNLSFLEKESENYTIRAIVNKITGESYICVFGR
jgi:hypothetical protein